MSEGDALLQSSVSLHKISLADLLQELQTSDDGLTSAQAKKKQAAVGFNTIPPPLSAPAWLCCLLPCLLRTKSMESFHECVPEHANIKRNGKWLKMDSASVVPGDLLKVVAGQRVAADMRIIEATKDCTFDTIAVTGKAGTVACNAATSTSDYLLSPNMAFVGYLCLAGECTGLAVATGADTVIGKLIAKGMWPPAGVDLTRA